MGSAVNPACRDASGDAVPSRSCSSDDLLALLLESEDPHLGLTEIVRLAVARGLSADPAEIVRRLDALVARGRLGRLPTVAAEPVFDTVPEPHAHIVYEETAQTVDLDVSTDTLLAILRRMLTERPDAVEVLIRVRGEAPSEFGAAGATAG